jgi:TolB-like protein
VDELESASRLGRSISEQVAARLTQHGFKVVEVKLRGSLFVKRAEGELLLSREIAKISQAYQAPAVVVGTYAPATNFVHINLKVVKANTQVVLAAADYGLPLDANTRALLHSGK